MGPVGRLCATTHEISTTPDVPFGGICVDQKHLPEEVVRKHNLTTVGLFFPEALPRGCQRGFISSGSAIYEFVSHEVGRHWAMALVDVTSELVRDLLLPDFQNLYVIIEGHIEMHHTSGRMFRLAPGQIVSHMTDGCSLCYRPQGACRILMFDFWHPEGSAEMLDGLHAPPALDSTSYTGSYTCEEFSSYHIISEEVTDKRWNISLVDIRGEISSHYHKLETQLVVVVSGMLEVTADNNRYLLKPGETIRVDPPSVHSLKPTQGTMVRAVFINFPAHDRTDAYDVVV